MTNMELVKEIRSHAAALELLFTEEQPRSKATKEKISTELDAVFSLMGLAASRGLPFSPNTIYLGQRCRERNA